MKRKWYFIGFIFVFIFFLSVNPVEAISKDLIEGTDDNISIPSIIYNTGSKITVYNSSDYVLYGQWLEINSEKYNEIKKAGDKCTDLSDTASEWSNANKPKKEDYVGDDDGYRKALETYNAKISEYNEQIKTCSTEYYNTIPDFDDNKWEKLEDDTVYPPSDAFSGVKTYILYIKLDDKTNSLVDYEVARVEIKGNVEEDKKEDKTNWKKLVENVKKSKSFSIFEDYTVSFEDGEDSLKVIITGKEGNNTYTVNFNYSEGIVSYSKPSGEPEGFEFAHDIVVGILLNEVCNLYGYDVENFSEWLSNNKSLKLENDGIEYTEEELKYGSDAFNIDFGYYISSLKVNIVDGIKSYKEQEKEPSKEEEKNPSTGDISMYALVGSIVLALGLGIVSYKKIKNS